MKVNKNGQLSQSIGERLDLAIYEGPAALKKLCRESGLDYKPFWVGVRDHLNVHIKETEAGLAANRNVVGFNHDAVGFVLNHYYQIRSFIESMILDRAN